MYELIIFPDPINATCALTHDTGGWTLVGQPATHPSGRPGQSFAIPADTQQGQGCLLTITADKKVPLMQRGILYLNQTGFPYPWQPGQTAAFTADDFHLVDAKKPGRTGMT